MLGVQNDSNGDVDSCSQIHKDAPLSAVDPGLVEFAPGLTITTSVASRSAAPVHTQTTTTTATASQC